jgi:hypothetical protein
VNGNFGSLGALGGMPGYHNGAVGQEPGATGYNNSTAARAATNSSSLETSGNGAWIDPGPSLLSRERVRDASLDEI